MYLCCSVEPFLQYSADSAERRHHLPAGSELTGPRNTMTFTLHLHVVEDSLERQTDRMADRQTERDRNTEREKRSLVKYGATFLSIRIDSILSVCMCSPSVLLHYYGYSLAVGLMTCPSVAPAHRRTSERTQHRMTDYQNTPTTETLQRHAGI